MSLSPSLCPFPFFLFVKISSVLRNRSGVDVIVVSDVGAGRLRVRPPVVEAPGLGDSW